jgi:putative transposase
MATGFIRKSPARRPISNTLSKLPIQYVTVCSAQRRPILTRPEAVYLILDSWKTANAFKVGRYVILPDHIHFFCAKSNFDSPHSLADWMKFWKSYVSQRWPSPKEQPIWQKDYWDRELRDDESYSDKWDYVRSNPVRHGLVESPDKWPYQGELHVLE